MRLSAATGRRGRGGEPQPGGILGVVVDEIWRDNLLVGVSKGDEGWNLSRNRTQGRYTMSGIPSSRQLSPQLGFDFPGAVSPVVSVL